MMLRRFLYWLEHGWRKPKRTPYRGTRYLDVRNPKHWVIW